MRRRRKIVIRVVHESRCTHIVSYTSYNQKYHTKSRRKGRCSRWTFLECGLCQVHHAKAEHHSSFGCKVMYDNLEVV